jgi:hypothetical protein
MSIKKNAPFFFFSSSDRVVFLGFFIFSQGVEADPKKIKAFFDK